MERKTRRRPNIRLLHVLNGISAGRPHRQILDELERIEQKHRADRLRGLDSELRVIEALRELQCVKRIRHSALYPQYDKQGCDVRAEIDSGGTLEFCIQVKSSDIRIDKAKKQLRGKFGFNKDQLEDWLNSRRRMFLNGQEPSDTIRNRFLSQAQKYVGESPILR